MERFLESLYVNRELHAVMFDPICRKYQITLTELLVLLFLKNNDEGTAKDIVQKLKLAKSHVSSSIRDLEEKGYLECHHTANDRRVIHLQICKSAEHILAEGEQVQKAFASVLVKNFSENEIDILKDYISRITENANSYLKGLLKK